MSSLKEKISRIFHAGIRMNWFNVLMITIGLVLAAEMIYSTYQTQNAFQSVFSVTDNYLASQQTTGMMDTMSASMLKEVHGYLEDGDPSHVHAFDGQRSALNAQLQATESLRAANRDSEANQHMENAYDAFMEMQNAEVRAMRLLADTLPVPMAAYPAFLQETELSAEDQALSPEEKRKTAQELISSDAFQQAKALMDSEIDLNHRLISDESQAEASQNQRILGKVVSRQKLFIFLFILLAVTALFVNRILMIRPIQQSIHILDSREKIPVHGSYEVRHMAEAYNAVLKDNEQKQEALTYTASHDALTGVLNRAAFESAYKSCREDAHGGLMIVDIDHFKTFNDTYGHDLGDRVLIHVARTIQKHFREEDLLCRIGGDEFVVLLLHTGLSHAKTLREKITRINEELSHETDDMPAISLSAGLAFREQLKEGQDLFKCADIALLSVKEHGRSACGLYDGKSAGQG